MSKKLYLFTAIISIALSGCDYIKSKEEKYAKLPAEGKTFDIKSFKSIRAKGVFNIVLSQADKESAIVKGDLPQGLYIHNVDNTLMIEDTMHFHISNHSVNTMIYITLKDVTDISVDMVGETTCADTLKLKTLKYTNEGVGETTLWVNADSVSASVSGVGELTVAGKTLVARIDDSGVGELDAKNLKADILHADVSGVGSAEVYADKELYLSCSGVGGVEYSGPAKVIQSISSGVGKVQHAD